MAQFILSAFADEAAGSLTEQIKILKEEGISHIELRGVDGVNCSDLSIKDAERIHQQLTESGIKLSALGSPYGKISITDSFEEHLEKFINSLEVCKVLDCSRIRMFSFYIPKDEDPLKYRDAVLARLEQMLLLAEEKGILLVHENEKGIYGDTDDRCMDLYNAFSGRLGIAFDPANYIQCGVDPLEAYKKQNSTITYFHMKDALKEDGSVVSVGNGNGSVEEILRAVNKTKADSVILTVEPHLHIFSGLSNLQEEKLKHKECYPDSKTAFHAAVTAVKNVLEIMED